MHVSLENYSISFEKDGDSTKGVLYINEAPLLHFYGDRFKVYKLEFKSPQPVVIENCTKISSFLTKIQQELTVSDMSIFNQFQTKGVEGVFSLLIEILLDLNILVYTNNNIRYNSIVDGSFIVARMGYNPLKSIEANYPFTQIKIIPTEAEDIDAVLQNKLGKMVSKVSLAYKFTQVVKEKNYSIDNLVQIHKNYLDKK